jgi:hypothetical protein
MYVFFDNQAKLDTLLSFPGFRLTPVLPRRRGEAKELSRNKPSKSVAGSLNS